MASETRYQRVAREQAERQARQEALVRKLHRGAARRTKRASAARNRPSEEDYESRLDDLGESPDY